MGDSSNFVIHKFNIERFAAQLQANMGAANSEYTRLMPLTSAAPVWDLHVYDFRAMLNGVAIIAPEQTVYGQNPLSTQSPAPPPHAPLAGSVKDECPNPAVGSDRYLNQPAYLSLGPDTSVNCGILQNYIWNEPREGKTAVMKLVVNKEPNQKADIYLSTMGGGQTGTFNYIVVRDYLCAPDNYQSIIANHGDGVASESYESAIIIQATCGPIEAEKRKITFTVIQRAAPGRDDGGVPDGNCFSDYLYWETDPAIGIARWMAGSTPRTDLDGTRGDEDFSTNVHIGCEAGGISTPPGNPVGVINQTRQHIYSTAVGAYSGHDTQGSVCDPLQIGDNSDLVGLLGDATAYGYRSGQSTQQYGATAIGTYAALSNQGALSVALGHNAGVQNNDTSNDKPTRNGTGRSGCATVQIVPGDEGTGYISGLATITNAVPPSCTGAGMIVDLTVDVNGAITGISVYQCGKDYCVGAQYNIVQNGNPGGINGRLVILSVGADGVSEDTQRARTIVINGSVLDGLNTDGLRREGHPLYARAPNAPLHAGEVWADAFYVKPIREQTYSAQLSRPAGDYRWGLFYNINTGEIVCSETGSPGIPNGNCMSEYLYWNQISGNWEIGGGIDNTGMSDYSVHFGCQAMGGLVADDGYGSRGNDAVAIGVNSAQFSDAPSTRNRATAVGAWSGYSGQGDDAIAIGAAAGLGVLPNDLGDMQSGNGAKITFDAGADLGGIQPQFQNSIVISGRGYNTRFLPLNTMNPTDVAAASTVFTGTSANVNQFTVQSPPSGATISVGDLVQLVNGNVSVPAGTYVCSADGNVNAVITICNADGTQYDLVGPPLVTSITIASSGSGPQPVLDPSPEVAPQGTTDAGGFFVAPLRSSVRNHILSYDTVTKEILYESFPQHNRLNAGDCYSDYLYWSPLAQKWLVGSLQVHIGCGAGGDDVSGQESQQGPGCVAVGRGAGHGGQGGGGVGNGRSVAIGVMSGVTDQGVGAVSVGSGISTADAIPVAGGAFAANLGQISQGQYSVSVGCEAGRFSQGQNAGNAVAVGHQAGHTAQGAQAIAIGALAAFQDQGLEGRAIGRCAAYSGQGANATAVGTLAGNYDTNCPPNSFVGDGGVNNNILNQHEANAQPASSIILNAALGDANANVDLNFNYVMFTAAPSQGLNGVFVQNSGHAPTPSDAGAAVVSIYNISSGQDLVQAGDRVLTVVAPTSITIAHQNLSVENYPVSALGYRIIIRNTGASPLMTGDALPLQALSQIGEVGFDAVDTPNVRSPVSGFFVSPIRQVNKNYQLSYDPTTKEVTYQYQKVAPDIGIGVCYSEYLYWDDGEANVAGFPTTPGWYVGGGGAFAPPKRHDLGRIHFGCGAGQYESSGPAVVGTRSNPLTIAVGYEAGQFGLGWGTNPTIAHANLGYTDTEGTIAIGYRACHESAFPRGVSIGYEAGRTGQGTAGLYTLNTTSISSADSCIAIGNQAGSSGQNLGAVAIGPRAGYTASSNAGSPGQGAHSVAIGNQAGFSSQGLHAIAIGHQAGCSMINRGPDDAHNIGCFPATTVEAQPNNSIILNAGDPRNGGGEYTLGPPAHQDWGPLQAIAGTSNACGAELDQGGSDYAVGFATTTGGSGSGLVIYIDAVAAVGGAIVSFFVSNCGSGYVATPPQNADILTVVQGVGANGRIKITNTENFPYPRAGSASLCEERVVDNQRRDQAGALVPMPPSGSGVTGFFVNPVRNVGGGFVMAYNPITKEIKYNASKPISDIVHIDDGDCYSEYLYWDDGSGTDYAGDPGWKVGGGPLNPAQHPDRGRVHIGCGAGQYQTAGIPGTRAGQQIVAIGFQAGHIAMLEHAVAIGTRAGYSGQETYAIAVGYQAGQTSQGEHAVAIGYQAGSASQSPDAVAIGNTAGNHDQGENAIAIGLTAGQTEQGDSGVAIGRQAGGNAQGIASIAIGYSAGDNSQQNNCIAIGSQSQAGGVNSAPGQFSQQTLSVAIGHNCGHTRQGIATLGNPGSALAIGNSCSSTEQGANSIAIGYEAGQSHGARAPFPAGQVFQSVNSIVVNSGDPKNANVNATNDHGPLQAISGSSIACGATINNAGTGYIAFDVVGGTSGLATTTGGTGNGFIIRILSVDVVGAIETFGIVSCGSGYLNNNILTVIQGVNSSAQLTLNNREIFPAPSAKATNDELQCILNQGNQNNMPATAGQAVTGFFVNPVRNVGGGFVMAYDPCTKEIKYNASKAIGDLPDLDDGDCYSEYLYWDDGLGTAYAGDPGWKVGGGPADGTTNPDRGRVHIGCGAGQYQSLNTPGTRAGQQIVAIGYQAGYIAMLDYAVAIGTRAGYSGQETYAIAVGYQAGQTSQREHAVAIGYQAGSASQSQDAVAIGNTAGNHDQGENAIAIGLTAGQTEQGENAIAIGNEAGSDTQGFESIAIGYQAGKYQQLVQSIAIGYRAGQTSQSVLGVAIGAQAGEENQQQGAVAIGYQAGEIAQTIRAVAIGYRAATENQNQFSIAIGSEAGYTEQGYAAAGQGNAGSAIAIGRSCSTSQQGANSIAIGYEAGQSHGARAPFPAGQVYQSINSIILNSGDPKNVGVNATNDRGPLQAVAGESNVCAVGSISVSGSNYSVGSATTTYVPGPGTGSGMVVEITSVTPGGAVTGVTITDCGSGYSDGDTLTLIQAGSDNNAEIDLSDAETFPTPNPGAGSAAIACVNNQGSNNDMPSAGAAVTGFFVNPVRNCSGGFVMSYNPCTKEIKYNASKLTDHLPDFDLQGGDCYSEYLYWDDGLGTAYAGDPGWKVGGGPADGTTNPDRGRVHIGCGAGQYQTAGTPGTRAGQQIVAIGYQAGHIAMLEYAVAIGSNAGYNDQQTYAIAVGYQAGQNSQSQGAVAIGHQAGADAQSPDAVAIGSTAGNHDQGQYAVAVGYQAGQNSQEDYAVAIGNEAGNDQQAQYAVAIGYKAGQIQQKDSGVAIGREAGGTTQGIASVAIGVFAASETQGDKCIAIGQRAGDQLQKDNCIAIGSRGAAADSAPGQHNQQTLSIAIGYNCGHTQQGYAAPGQGNAGSAIAIGNSCSSTDQGANSIAIGYEAGQSHGARTPFPAGQVYQSVNSIILNSGDPKNANVNATTDRGPLQAVAGDNETFPGPVSASAAEEHCINNQGNLVPMPPAGDQVTGFFVNPVRNCSGGFVMTYNPCTKEIKYNASKPIDKIPADIDEGDCYSEYLYWNDGADGIVPAGWRKGGGNLGAGAPPAGDLGRIHIGCGAGQYESHPSTVGNRSGDRSVAVGYDAGHYAMQERAVAVGESAGFSNQGSYATAVGQQAGWRDQGQNAVAVGRLSGYLSQGRNAVAVGHVAGSENQNNFAVAVGNITARYSQGAHAVAIGYRAAEGVSGSGQGEDSIAVGHETARYNQGTRAVAIGYLAAEGTVAQGQGEEAIAIGYQAGRENQGIGAVAIGSAIPGSARSAGQVNQGAYAVAVGPSAGESDQLINAVAVGSGAGQFSQNGNAVAVGIQSGRYNQLGNSVAVGAFSGYTGQQTISVAIGWFAGHNDQGTTGGGATGAAVAIGSQAGEFDQRARSVAVGSEAGRAQQRQVSVAVGYRAGEDNQGLVGGGFFEGGAVAIGSTCGQTDQHALSIAIGAICGTANQQPHSIAIGTINTPGVTANCQEADSIILGNSYTDVPAGALCLGSRTNLGAIPMSGQAANATYIQQIRTAGDTVKTLQWNSTTREVTYHAKSFVKEHPVDRDRYLVHACLEGPENGLYYRGKGVVPENEKSVLVQLPRYACLIGGDWTIQLTAQGSFNRFYATEVADDDGFVGFRVFAEQPGKFYWIVHGRQKDKPLETEPRKADVVLRGQGPYTFLQKR